LVKGYDPVATTEARKIFSVQEMHLCGSLAEAVSNTEAVVLVTRWDEFRKISELLAPQNPPPLFVDGRRMVDKLKIARYEGIGLDAT
jgi:UDPglucose 6-dehydrogenase/GDP-mannose 6-dehydrogenase